MQQAECEDGFRRRWQRTTSDHSLPSHPSHLTSTLVWTKRTARVERGEGVE